MANDSGLRSRKAFRASLKIDGDTIEDDPYFEGAPTMYWLAPPKGHDPMIKVSRGASQGFVKSGTNNLKTIYRINNEVDYPLFPGTDQWSSGWGCFVPFVFTEYPAANVELGVGVTLLNGAASSVYKFVLFTKSDNNLYMRTDTPSKNIDGSVIKGVETLLVDDLAGWFVANPTLTYSIILRCFICSGTLQFEASQRENLSTSTAIIPDYVLDVPVVKQRNFLMNIFYDKMSTTLDSPILGAYNFMAYGFDRLAISPVFLTTDGYEYEYTFDAQGQTDAAFDGGAGVYRYYTFNTKVEYRDRDNKRIKVRTLQIITDEGACFVAIDGRMRVIQPNTLHRILIKPSMTEIGIACLGGSPNIMLTTEILK